jgi:hypothetical protein
MRSPSGVKRDDPRGIDERSFRFYTDVLGFLDTVPRGPKTDRLIEQLADSSRREFLRSMRSHCAGRTNR